MELLWRNADNAVCVNQLTDLEEVGSLVRLFERVADEEGWQPGGALRLGMDRSVYLGLEVRGHLAGGLQIVLPGVEGTLSCQTIWPEVDIGPSNRCAHISIMALDSGYRGKSALFWHLAAEMWRYCVGKGISNLYIEVTPRVLPLYHRLGWPLKIVGEARVHWGEDCYLCSLGIPEVAEAILRRAEHSHYYQQIVSQAFRVNVSGGTGYRSERRELCAANC